MRNDLRQSGHTLRGIALLSAPGSWLCIGSWGPGLPWGPFWEPLSGSQPEGSAFWEGGEMLDPSLRFHCIVNREDARRLE
jgi:hypothetical protein